MNYAYEACNRQGEHFQGQIEAGSRQEAAHKIRRQGLWITSLQEVMAKSPHASPVSHFRRLFTGREISPAQTACFCRQMAVLLTAGMPVHEALKSLLAGGGQGIYGQLLARLYQKVLKGKALSAAMEEESGSFSPQLVRLVEAGEQGGSLEAIFTRLADFLEQCVKAKEKMKSILLYPAIIAITALVVLIFMTLSILPTFASLLANLQSELPLATKLLLQLSAFLQERGQLLCVLSLPCLGILYIISQLPQVRFICARLLLSLPFMGRLAQHTAWSLVLGTLALLIEQGIVLHEALKMAAKTAGNPYLEQEILQVQAKVEQGSSLMKALSPCPFFPPMLQEMLEAGEQSGQLETMLNKAAAFCQVLAENESTRLQALAEPAAIFAVGGLVFFMVMAVIMPLLNTMDALTM